MHQFATTKIRAYLSSKGVEVSEEHGLTSSETEAYFGFMCGMYAAPRESVQSSLIFLDSLRPQEALDAVLSASDGVEDTQVAPVITSAPVTPPQAESVKVEVDQEEKVVDSDGTDQKADPVEDTAEVEEGSDSKGEEDSKDE